MNPYASMMGGLDLAEATNPLQTGTADALIAELVRRKREEEQRRQLMQPQSPIAAAVMQPAPQPATTGVFGGGPNRFAQQEDLIEQMRANVADARRMNAAPPAPVDPSSPAWDFVQRQARGLSQPQQSPLGTALTQGPAAAPDPNKLENVIAGYLQRNPQGTDYKSFSVRGDGDGGLDFTQKNRLRQGDVAPRKVNSVAGDATRQQGRSARLDERQQNRVALGEERRKEGQQSALMASLMADPRSAAAFMGLQGDMYTANKETEAETAAQHAQFQIAPFLIGVQNGTMTPEAAQQGIASVLAAPSSGQPVAGGSPVVAPSASAIGSRIKAAEVAKGEQKASIIESLTPQEAAAMTPEQIIALGLNEESLMPMQMLYEGQAQEKTGLGRMLSGPGSTTPFGIGMRDPSEVMQAARKLQVVNNLLNNLARSRG